MSLVFSKDLKGFPFAEYRFNFTAQTDFLLPTYTGSAWRGLFGHALKKTVCITHETSCQGCLLSQQCVYSYVFETPPPENTDIMRNYPSAPHPFIIRPDPNQAQWVKKGDRLFIDMVLIGRANQHLPYMIYALQRAGKRGIGFQRGKFSLSTVQQHIAEGKKTIYTPTGKLSALPASTMNAPAPPQGKVTLRFTTPFRNIQKDQLTSIANLQFDTILSPLIRRFFLLSYFHTETVFQPDFKAFTKKAKQVKIKKRSLYWQQWQRYSSRQKNSINMGGVMGSIELAAKDIQPFWEILVLGQYMHVGKVTVMGLGRYSLEYKETVKESVL